MLLRPWAGACESATERRPHSALSFPLRGFAHPRERAKGRKAPELTRAHHTLSLETLSGPAAPAIAAIRRQAAASPWSGPNPWPSQHGGTHQETSQERTAGMSPARLARLSGLLLVGRCGALRPHVVASVYFTPDFWGWRSESHLQSQALLKAPEGSGRRSSLERTMPVAWRAYEAVKAGRGAEALSPIPITSVTWTPHLTSPTAKSRSRHRLPLPPAAEEASTQALGRSLHT